MSRRQTVQALRAAEDFVDKIRHAFRLAGFGPKIRKITVAGKAINFGEGLGDVQDNFDTTYEGILVGLCRARKKPWGRRRTEVQTSSKVKFAYSGLTGD
ncbi:hypothetical protein PILCRDRAFT_816973, partial [Piloderma croceum F 1598]